MLHHFLADNQTEILKLAEEKITQLAGIRVSTENSKAGIKVFYQYMIEFLKDANSEIPKEKILAVAAKHGQELLNMNYTLSQVVHAYGAVCQAVTECATKKAESISPSEFHSFNLCLDYAIASAVSEFQFQSVKASEKREFQQMGFLVHELRNSLSSATVAQDMITRGLVGTGGSTAQILSNSLSRMRNLIDRSLAEVRMRNDPKVDPEVFLLSNLIDQVLITAKEDASKKSQTIHCHITEHFELETDRMLLISAVSNLVQNAIKYSSQGGVIGITLKGHANHVNISIENDCGPEDIKDVSTMLQPFISGTHETSGLGLGLTIVQRAVHLLNGNLTVKRGQNRSYIFKIDIPLKWTPKPKIDEPSGGVQAVHPPANNTKPSED